MLSTLEKLYSDFFSYDSIDQRQNSSFLAWVLALDWVNWAKFQVEDTQLVFITSALDKDISAILNLPNTAVIYQVLQARQKALTELLKPEVKQALQQAVSNLLTPFQPAIFAKTLGLETFENQLGQGIAFSDQAGRKKQDDRFFYFSDDETVERGLTLLCICDGVGRLPKNAQLLAEVEALIHHFQLDHTLTKEIFLKSLESLHVRWVKQSTQAGTSPHNEAATTAEIMIHDQDGIAIYSLGDSGWYVLAAHSEPWDFVQKKRLRDSDGHFLTAALGYGHGLGYLDLQSRKQPLDIRPDDWVVLATDGAEFAIDGLQRAQLVAWLESLDQLPKMDENTTKIVLPLLAMSMWRMLALLENPLLGDNRTAVLLHANEKINS